MYSSYFNEGKHLVKGWLSRKKEYKREGYLYIDLHVHFLPLSCYPNGLDTIINEAMKRVDVISLTERDTRRPYSLAYNDFKSALKESKYEYRDLGRVIEVKKNSNVLYVVESQEVMTKQNLHFLAVGSSKKFHDYQDLSEAIDLAKEDGIAIMPHPFSVNAPIIIGRLTSKKEREALAFNYGKVDAIEVFNTMNNLWLFRSNVIAKKFAEKNNIIGVAASDTHCDLNQLGLAGIYVKKEKIKINTDDEFVSSLKEAIKNNDFVASTYYDNPFVFAKRLLWPYVKRVKSLKEVADLMLFLLMHKPKYEQDSIDSGN